MTAIPFRRNRSAIPSPQSAPAPRVAGVVMVAMAVMAACFLAACNVGGDKETRHTLSFSNKFDSLKTFDRVVIVVKDPAGAYADTLFDGAVDSKADIENLASPNYQGGMVEIGITGYAGGAVAYQVEKKVDGSSGRTEGTVVKVAPDTKLVYSGGPLAGKAGDTVALPGVEVSPSNLADKEIGWTSTHPDVAAVSGQRLALKAAGSAEIVATLKSDPGRTLRISVTVTAKIDGNLPPAAPSIASLIPGDSKAALSWDPVAGAESYNVYYGEGNAVDKGSTRVKSANSPYLVLGLKNGTTYAFGVTAVNAAGESDIGTQRTAVPAAAAASAPSITGAAAGDGKVTLTWSAVEGAVSYVVYHAAGSTVDKGGSKSPGAVSPLSITGLANGTQYAFAVAAVSGAGESPLGGIATATPRAAPAGLSYAANPAVYWVNAAITPNVPYFTGEIDSFGVSPALPAGLGLDKEDGTLAGTPSAAAPVRDYVITGYAAAGNLTATLALSVNGAPADLKYSPDSAVFTQGSPIAALVPSVSGRVDTFSIAPAPPAGLVFDRSTGALSGTPAARAAPAAYTVTARNPAGSATAILRLSVIAPASGLSYSLNPASYWVGRPIAANNATVEGNVDSFTVSPALPAGLALDKSTGAITGTPTAAAASKSYTVTAHGAAGAVTASLGITVSGAPSAFSYSLPVPVYWVGKATAANTPAVSGQVDSFTVAPPLPAGISLAKGTGIIQGTPSAASAATSYTVTAHNPAGTATAQVNITVNGKPSGLAYAVNPAVYYLYPIAANAATVTGLVDSFTVSPALPAGLSLNKGSGAVTGAPTAARAAANYIITAHNPAGTVAVNLNITVNGPPSGLGYPGSPFTFWTGKPLGSGLLPAVTGQVDSFTVSPPLPSGLSLAKATGLLSGTPTAAQAASPYTVTAHNKSGTAEGTLSIAIGAAPSGLSYLRNSYILYRFVPILPNPATVAGQVDSFTVSPALPAGLSLDKATGLLTGTPTTAAPQAAYTFRAHNPGGSAAFVITLTVKGSIGGQVKQDHILDTTSGNRNFGGGPIIHIGHHPKHQFVALLDFGLDTWAKNALDSAHILVRSFGGGSWTGENVTLVARTYRLLSAWTEGTGNHYYHRGGYKNGGQTLLTHYPLSNAVMTASTDPADTTSALTNQQPEIVRAANVVLTDVDTIVVSHGAAATLANGVIPKPEYLVDLKIRATNYVNGVLGGSLADYGCMITLEGTSDTKNLNYISKEGGLQYAPYLLAN